MSVGKKSGMLLTLCLNWVLVDLPRFSGRSGYVGYAAIRLT